MSRTSKKLPEKPRFGLNSRWRAARGRANLRQMSLKQEIHTLVGELPDDSPLLADFRDTLRMDHAIGEAMEDLRQGRTYSAEEFLAKVEHRWPSKVSA